MYASEEDYKAYLQGRTEIIPLTEFLYWSEQAGDEIDLNTRNRLNDAEVLDTNKIAVIKATCRVAEAMYTNESPDAERKLTSESVGGWSGSYETAPKAPETKAAQYRELMGKTLLRTGLMYRGM